MDVNTANILPLIWASKFNLGLPNLADPVPSIANSMSVTNSSTNTCSTLNRPSMANNNSPNGPNLWPAAAAAALSNDFTTSFKQLLANAAAAVNTNGIGSTFPQAEAGDVTFNGSNQTTPLANGFNGNGNSNSNGPRSPNAGAMNGINLQQALIARLGQAAAASILGDKQQGAYPMQAGQLQLPNNKLMHLMPNYCNPSSPGKNRSHFIFHSIRHSISKYIDYIAASIGSLVWSVAWPANISIMIINLSDNVAMQVGIVGLANIDMLTNSTCACLCDLWYCDLKLKSQLLKVLAKAALHFGTLVPHFGSKPIENNYND